MQWKLADPDKRVILFEDEDPFASWILGPGFGDFSRGEDPTVIPATFGPLTEDTAEFVRKLQEPLTRGEARREGLFISWLYRNVQADQYAVAFFRRDLLDSLSQEEDLLREVLPIPIPIRLQVDLGLPLKLKSLPKEWQSGQEVPPPEDPPVFTPSGGWLDKTVVVGIIDDGLGFAHERFRLADGTTRVQYFWQQDGLFQGPHSTVSYGREICKLAHAGSPGIDDLLKVHDQDGIVNEDGLYRDAGLADFGDGDHKAVAWRRAHGTHILDHAAGEHPELNRPDRPIIAVQLPVSVTADTSGSNLKPYALDAINYIIDRAKRLGGNKMLPVVINFSYGMIAGPHDGTLDLEQAIDELVGSCGVPLRVVLPAGNANLSRCHATLTFKNNDGPKSLFWRVQPDDLTPTFLEIWMPGDQNGKPAQGRVAIEVTTPSGLASMELVEGSPHGIELVEDRKVIASVVYSYRSAVTKRGIFAISLAPSARLGEEPGEPTSKVPSGRWRVTVRNIGLSEGQEVNAWIQWDDVIYGYRRNGRQSYFEADCYVRFDPISGDVVDTDDPTNPCHVLYAGTLNAIATGKETVVIGSVQQKDLRPPKYTASGPITPVLGNPPHRTGPDAGCVSDDSRIHSGILGAGSHSGSTVLMSGTSVAVPQVVRLVAEWLANKGPADRHAVQSYAAAKEAGLPMPGPGGPPPLDMKRNGAGRIVPLRPDWLPRLD